MKLTLAIHPITEMRFAAATGLDGQMLNVNREELRRRLLEDDLLEDIEIEIVSPGEACRVGVVFDILEPRAKAPGDGSDFPGVLGSIEAAGRGTTHVLRGAAVTVLENATPRPASQVGAAATPSRVTARDTGRCLEMSGEAAKASPYSALVHLVLIPRPRAGLERHRARAAARLASAKAAAYLAGAAIEHPPATTEEYETAGPSERADGRPRFAYIGQVHSRQVVAEPDEHILYGHNTTGMVPVALHPNEWLDGAMFTGYQSIGVETYFHQNHPVILELYRRHREGKIAFVGTVATMAASNNEDRDRLCMFAAGMAKWNLAADGVVLTKFGGGAPHADMALTALACERMGIRTSVQVGPPDLSSDRTAESAALFNYPEVDAIVYSSGGNYYEWPAPPVERVIAPNATTEEALASLTKLTGSNVCGIASQQGASRLRVFVY